MSDFEKLKSDLFGKDSELKEMYLETQPEYDIANAIIRGRIDRDLTQEDLAKATGIQQAKISRLERGDANPSLKTLKRLAKGLNMQLKISFEPAEEQEK